MLNKTIKKLIALTLATVTVVTSSTAVSASTLTPKKSHSDNEVQERVLYLIDAADDIAFSPYGGFAGDAEGGDSYNRRHKMHSYMAYQMCNMLFATPNLDSACSPETVAELKEARNTWKSAYVSDLMYLFYSQVWYDTDMAVTDKYMYETYKNPRLWDGYTANNLVLHIQPSKISAKANSSYNRVKKYVAKYQKYNPKLAANILKWNATQYKSYKKLASKAKTLTPSKLVKMGQCDTIVGAVWNHYKLADMGDVGQLWVETKLLTKNGTWYWSTKGMHPNNNNPNSPFNTFAKNVKYGAW